MKPNRRKRLVTKGEYALHLSKQFSLTSLCVVCLIMGFLCFCVAIFTGVFWLSDEHQWDSPALAWSVICWVMSCVLLRAGSTAKHQMETAEPVAPLTRHNTDKLPPEESLVRAASEPLMPQEEVLLRPASGTVEADPQQLLRASVSQDNPSD